MANFRLKNALVQQKPAFATFMTLKGMRTAQVVAHTGLDASPISQELSERHADVAQQAVIVDREHGNIEDGDMHDMVSAIASSGISPIVRIRGISGPLIKRALDTGAHGILAPMINTAEDARSVVSFSKFPPVGVRGQGSPFACFEHGFATPSEYVAHANDNILIMIQIESMAALDNLEEICEVPGIDLVFIGPNDLALALLGYTPAKYTEEVFLKAIDRAVATAKRHKKKVGILAVDGDHAKELKQRFDLVVISADARALQAWYKQQLTAARQ